MEQFSVIVAAFARINGPTTDNYSAELGKYLVAKGLLSGIRNTVQARDSGSPCLTFIDFRLANGDALQASRYLFFVSA